MSTKPSVVKREPVLTAASAVVLIVTLANVFGVVIDASVLENVIIGVLTIVAAIKARTKVSPTLV